jgi:Zn-dependent protease
MLNFDQRWLLETAIEAPGLIFSLTVHEFAHARVALAFGDPTAQMQGRVSLNPLRHLDPIGTIALFLIGFGWARPVPVNPNNLHPPRMGDICVSLAGVACNLLLAVLFGALTLFLFAQAPRVDPQGWAGLKELFDGPPPILAYVRAPGAWALLTKAALYAGVINVILCVFNLIPLYPLDGHHVVAQMVDPWRRPDFLRWQMQYGMVVLMVLMFAPRLLSGVGRGAIPDPIGWLIGHAVDLFARAIQAF